MTQTHKHILIKEGILTSFGITKKIVNSDFKKISKIAKKSNIIEALKKVSVDEIKKTIEKFEIPGLLYEEPTSEDGEKKKLMELTYFASLMSKKISDKNLEKYYSCYIINALVNMLNLSESDFIDFHERFSKFKEGNSESEI